MYIYIYVNMYIYIPRNLYFIYPRLGLPDKIQHTWVNFNLRNITNKFLVKYILYNI